MSDEISIHATRLAIVAERIGALESRLQDAVTEILRQQAMPVLQLDLVRLRRAHEERNLIEARLKGMREILSCLGIAPSPTLVGTSPA